MFGGYVNGMKTNEICSFNFKDSQWDIVKPKSKATPQVRAGHSATIAEDKMIVVGGLDDDNERLNDVWEYDMTKNEWNELDPHDAEE